MNLKVLALVLLAVSCGAGGKTIEEYYHAEDWDALLEEFEKSDGSDLDRIYAAYARDKLGDAEEVRALLASFRNKPAVRPELLFLLSGLYLSYEDYDRVIENLEDTEPLQAGHLALARAYYEKGEVSKSLRLMALLVERFPEETELANYYQAFRLVTLETETPTADPSAP